MSVANEITRLQGLRNALRTKLIALGIITDAAADLEDCTDAVGGITDNGAVNVEIVDKTTVYTVPQGYHDGAGTVMIDQTEADKLIAGNIRSGVSILGTTGSYTGAGANLQSKNAIPTKAQQNIVADAGYDGLSNVTVGAIPDAYQDVSATTAAAQDILAGKVFTEADGTVTTGTMVNNGAVAATFDGLTAATSSYTVPAGYHSGTGTVSLTNDIETQLAAI